MAAQIEVKLRGMCDAHVDRGARRNVARFARLLLFVGAKQSSVMTLLHHNERDARPIVRLQLNAGLPNRRQLVLQHMWKLSLGHTVSVQNDAMWFVAAGRFVKHDEQLADHAAELLNDFLSMLLDANGGRIT